MKKLKFLLLASLVPLCGSALAFNANDFPVSTLGNRVTFGNGVIGGGSLGGGTLSAASDGTILARGPVSFTAAGGVKLEAQLAGRIAKPVVAAAVGRFATKVITPIAIGSALYDLAKELGYLDFGKNSSGQLVASVDTTTQVLSVVSNYDNAGYTDTPNNVCERYGFNGYGTHGAIYLDGDTSSNTGARYRCGGNGNILFAFGIPGKGKEVRVVPAEEFQQKLENKQDYAPNSALGPAFEQAIKDGQQADISPETLTGPATTPGTKTTTTTATGSTTTTTTNNYNYEGPVVTVSTSTVTQNFDTTGAPVGTPTTTTTAPEVVPEKEIKVCGLTTATACKIDETGTPPPDPAIDGKKAADDALGKLKDFGAHPEASLPPLPSLNWAFRLPTGCVPFSIPAFAPFLQSIDICQFQPMFHDIMSMVWTIGGLFGAIGLFWRNTLSQN